MNVITGQVRERGGGGGEGVEALADAQQGGHGLLRRPSVAAVAPDSALVGVYFSKKKHGG